MATPKTSTTKRTGEGTRERRKVDWNARATNGASKKYAKPRMPAPPPKVAPAAAKAPHLPPRVPPANPRGPSPPSDPDSFVPLPAPGGHSLDMTQKLADKGRVPPPNPFAKLAAQAKAKFEAKTNNEEAVLDAADRIDQDIVADMTRVRGGERRSTRTHEDRVRAMAEGVEAAPALRSDPFDERIAAAHAEAELEPDAKKRAEIKRALPRKRDVLPLRKEQKLAIADLFQLPGVVCNNCPAHETCPDKRENYECAYEPMLRALPSADLTNALPFAETISDLHAQRALRGVLLERLTAGGAIDPTVTRQMEIAVEARLRVVAMRRAEEAPLPPPAHTMTASFTTTTAAGVVPGGGLMSALIGAVMSGKPAVETISLPAASEFTPGRILDTVGEEVAEPA